MIMTQYLHQLGRECDLSAAIVVSVIWDPFVSRVNLEERLDNKLLYSRAMVNGIKSIVKR